MDFTITSPEQKTIYELRRIITDLECKIDDLEFEKKTLKKTILDDIWFPGEMKLTRSEQTILRFLLKRPLLTKEIFANFYGAGDVDTDNILSVFISKLRGKLRPYQIDIGTNWGVGFFLDSDNKKRLKQAIDDLNKKWEAA